MARGQGTLEVKFKPVGQKPLITALRTLHSVTTRLTKEYDKLEKVTKGTDKGVKGFFNSLGLGIRNTRNTNKGLSKLNMSFSVLRSQLLLAGFAMTLFSKTIGAAARKYFEQEKSLIKLSTALDSTGRSAKVTTSELSQFASQLQSITTFGDEEIISAQALLATFTSIGEDVFPQATKAILNLATAMGQDLQQTTIQVGKALNDPVLGMTALRRVGIQLNGTQQESIKNFVKQGDVMSAQKVILQELTLQFGGMAEAMGMTAGGKMQQLSNTWGDIGERFGQIFLEIGRGTGFMDFLDRKTKEFQENLGIANQEVDVLNSKMLFQLDQMKKLGTTTLVVVDLFKKGKDITEEENQIMIEQAKLIQDTYGIEIDQVGELQKLMSNRLTQLKFERNIAEKNVELTKERNNLEVAKKNMDKDGAIIAAKNIKKIEQLIDQDKIHLNITNEATKQAEEQLGINGDLVLQKMTENAIENEIVANIEKKFTTSELLKKVTSELTGELREQAIAVGMIADQDLTPAEYAEKVNQKIVSEKEFVAMLQQAKIEAGDNLEVQEEIEKTINRILGITKEKAEVEKETPDHLKSQKELIKEITENINNTIQAEQNQLDALNAILESGNLEEEQKKRILELQRQITGETEKQKLSNFEASHQAVKLMSNELDAWVSTQNKKLDTEIANERARDDFQQMSAHAQEARIEELRAAHAKKYKALFLAQKTAAIGEVAFNTAINMAKYPLNPVLKALVAASGVAASVRIASQDIPTYEQGGVVGGRRHRYGGTPIEAEQGEFVMSRNAVSRIGLANLNRMNAGGGGGVTVNVSGNVLTQDFVENELAERIRRAVQRGKDFGIS